MAIDLFMANLPEFKLIGYFESDAVEPWIASMVINKNGDKRLQLPIECSRLTINNLVMISVLQWAFKYPYSIKKVQCVLCLSSIICKLNYRVH